MTTVWPRLPMAVTSEYLRRARAGHPLEPTTSHPKQVYAEVGERVRPTLIHRARTALLELATELGFPDHDLSDAHKNTFDRAAAHRLVQDLQISWSEAANRDLWNFVTFVVLPDLTRWRWASARTFTDERWVARDLMRHTWARLWWQATTFRGHDDLLVRIQESELNQLFERRAIGGEPDLVVATTGAVLDAIDEARAPRRELFREVTKRLRRATVYIDTSAMTPGELRTMVDRLVDESVTALMPVPAAAHHPVRHLHLESGQLLVTEQAGPDHRDGDARSTATAFARLVDAVQTRVSGRLRTNDRD